jgi:hypothetical protein
VRNSVIQPKRTIFTLAGAIFGAGAVFALGGSPAFAVEQQCRFIQAKTEREACYQRQEAELAAKRKHEPSEPTADSKMFQSQEQMNHEDEALNRQIHGICRGC